MNDNKFDKAVESYEKGFDKVANALDGAQRVGNRLQIGCLTIFFNLFFAAFCMWGVFAAYTAWNLDQNGATTEGTVIRLTESSDAESGCCTYSPVIEFRADGKTYTFEGNNASNPPAYEVGETVPVIYDPADPETAQINKWFERWLFPILIIPVMIGATLIVNFFMVRSWMRG